MKNLNEVTVQMEQESLESWVIIDCLCEWMYVIILLIVIVK